jgi:hypothetical protein
VSVGDREVGSAGTNLSPVMGSGGCGADSAKALYHESRYDAAGVMSVSHAISVRLDDRAFRALRMLEAAGMSRSEAIRRALVDAAERLRRRHELAAEAAALEADADDRQEMLDVAAMMESLRAPG